MVIGDGREVRCPRCHAAFRCGSSAIEQCQCRAVVLSAARRADLAARYDGCLCAGCVAELAAQLPLAQQPQ